MNSGIYIQGYKNTGAGILIEKLSLYVRMDSALKRSKHELLKTAGHGESIHLAAVLGLACFN